MIPEEDSGSAGRKYLMIEEMTESQKKNSLLENLVENTVEKHSPNYMK